MGDFLRIDAEKQILLIHFEGVVTDESLLDGYRRVRKYFIEHGHCGNISDFTGVTSFEVTARAIRSLASNTPLVPESFVRILVAPKDEVYGMARMFEMAGSMMGNRVDIVRSLGEAYQLAGIDGRGLQKIEE